MALALPLLLALLPLAHAPGGVSAPVVTTVRHAAGKCDVALFAAGARSPDGVLHLKLCGRISRHVALRSIQATTTQIKCCHRCTAVVEMGACKGVSPLALPVTARFLLSHWSLWRGHIIIIEARGPVLLACNTVRRLSRHSRFEIYRSWADFEAACGDNAAHHRLALRTATRSRPGGTVGQALGSRLRSMRDRLEKATTESWASKGLGRRAVA